MPIPAVQKTVTPSMPQAQPMPVPHPMVPNPPVERQLYSGEVRKTADNAKANSLERRKLSKQSDEDSESESGKLNSDEKIEGSDSGDSSDESGEEMAEPNKVASGAQVSKWNNH
jgi:hypothetical protein